MSKNQLIILTGPTAVGKTKLAAKLALRIGGEIISADSRQVYKKMNIGAGKDLNEYIIDNQHIPYHLIDIREPGYRYSIKEFYPDFVQSYKTIVNRGCVPILCGGSGLYIETALRGNHYSLVPENLELRGKLDVMSDEVLYQKLSLVDPDIRLFADISSRTKIIRALEIDEYLQHHQLPHRDKITLNPVIFALQMDREKVKERIKLRLQARLEEGLIEEVKALLDSGVSEQAMAYYGLEYKWVSAYILGQMTYAEMFERLNISIRQFAKKQMTWFRRMEKQGYELNWINAEQSIEDQLSQVLEKLA